MKTKCWTIVTAVTAFLQVSVAGSEDWTYRGQLHKAIRDADRIVVRDGGFDCCGPADEDKVLFEITDRKEIVEVYKGLEFEVQQEDQHCLCSGYPRIEWYKAGKPIALTSFHHGLALRWDGFPGVHVPASAVDAGSVVDARLMTKSSDWMTNWLAKHGVKKPKEELEQQRGQREGAQEHREPAP